MLTILMPTRGKSKKYYFATGVSNCGHLDLGEPCMVLINLSIIPEKKVIYHRKAIFGSYLYDWGNYGGYFFVKKESFQFLIGKPGQF